MCGGVGNQQEEWFSGWPGEAEVRGSLPAWQKPLCDGGGRAKRHFEGLLGGPSPGKQMWIVGGVPRTALAPALPASAQIRPGEERLSLPAVSLCAQTWPALSLFLSVLLKRWKYLKKGTACARTHGWSSGAAPVLGTKGTGLLLRSSDHVHPPWKCLCQGPPHHRTWWASCSS